mmetsp:Transcript_11553/g.28291  ORF Transcript_11553/g.28291 Transcript_11553/m.28291 type:complete len:258 (-) Transcript_11553:26-799(-)
MRIRISSASTSCATPWLMRCARKRPAAVHTGLSLRLYERMNCRHSLCSSSSPSSGNLVLTTATSAAYTGENAGEASCDFIMERQNRPRPRTRFSRNTSASMFLMLVMLTLFTMPLIDFLRASQVRRWYSGVLLSFTSCIMRASLKGGMYTPPARPVLTGLRSGAGSAATGAPLAAAAASGSSARRLLLLSASASSRRSASVSTLCLGASSSLGDLRRFLSSSSSLLSLSGDESLELPLRVISATRCSQISNQAIRFS